jgi:hypothetical protein
VGRLADPVLDVVGEHRHEVRDPVEQATVGGPSSRTMWTTTAWSRSLRLVERRRTFAAATRRRCADLPGGCSSSRGQVPAAGCPCSAAGRRVRDEQGVGV